MLSLLGLGRAKGRPAFRGVVYNVGDGKGVLKYQDLNDILEEDPDMIGLLEVADRGDVIQRWLQNHPGWAFFNGDGSQGAAKTGVLYRTKVKVTSKKSHRLTPRFKLPKGAGPENAPPKVANRLRFKWYGKRSHFIVCHQYATVHNRMYYATRFITALTQVVVTRLGSVVVVGDFNQERHQNPLRLLTKVVRSWSQVGKTRDSREIDGTGVS